MNSLQPAMFVGIISFLITVVLMPFFIPFLKRLKFGQSIREDGPKSHMVKQGTPTMGGIVFVIATIVALLIVNFTTFFTQPLLSIIIVFIGFFLIGLADDLLIVVKKHNDGLSPKLKLLFQALVTIVLFVFSPFLINQSNTTIDFFTIPLNLGYAFPVFVLIMFVAYSNAFNLTDGLDGLSSITSVIAYSFMGIIAYNQGNYVVLTAILAINGALLGFFVFNVRPAKIFMGDTGSLALGGFYAIIALLLKVELLSIVIGFVFVMETVSVIIQVASFKKTGKRVFRMTPIHHHFEMGRLGEKYTVILFYIIGIISGLIGMVIYFG